MDEQPLYDFLYIGHASLDDGGVGLYYSKQHGVVCRATVRQGNMTKEYFRYDMDPLTGDPDAIKKDPSRVVALFVKTPPGRVYPTMEELLEREAN